MLDSSLLPIGRIRKAHGIKGEVSVDYYADSPDLLRSGVYLRQGNAAPVLREVESCRSHHGSLLIRFAGIPDKTAADSLRGQEILIPEERFPEPDNNEIYLHQLIGLTVIHVEETGLESTLGEISTVSDNTGQELWTISTKGEEDILFPATPEFVLNFNLETRVVRISPPPGLIDLYRP